MRVEIILGEFDLVVERINIMIKEKLKIKLFEE